MAYRKKAWRDRISEHPWRRLLLDVESGETRTVELERNEGEIHTEGDVLNAAALNDLEGRVSDGFAELDGSLQGQEGMLDALQAYAAEIAGAAAEHSGDLGNPHRISPAQIGAASVGALTAHEADSGNPHGVTAGQIGAVTPAELLEHAEDQSNPHGITLDMLGGAPSEQLTTHVVDEKNPHGVTAAQAGAYSTTEADQEFLHNEGTEAAPVLKGSVRGNADTATTLQTKSFSTGEDLNDFKALGRWRAMTTALAGTLINRPTSKAFVLDVIPNSGVTQIVIEYSETNPKIFFRNYYSYLDTWSDWFRIYSAANKPTAAEVGALAANGTAVDTAKLNGQAASYYATAAGLLAHTGSTGNPHGVTPAQIGAVANASFTTEVARLESLIDEAAASGGSGVQPRLINMCPYASKVVYGGDLTVLRNTPGAIYTASFAIVMAASGGDFAGYYTASLAGISTAYLSIQFTTQLTGVTAGEQLPLTACFADMNTYPQDVTLTLVDADGEAVSDSASITADPQPKPTVNQAVLTVTKTSAKAPFYVQYNGETNTRTLRAEHRIFLLQLYALRDAAMTDVMLERESYDPLRVGSDAFDAYNHKLSRYVLGSGGSLSNGDRVVDALAKLEARIKTLESR